MPFDGCSPSSAVQILDTLSESLRRGDLNWIQYPKTGSAPRGACLLEATDQIRHDYGTDAVTFDQIARLLAAAIRGSASTRPDLNNNAVTEYNDAKGRTLDDILGVIRKAKLLARGAGELP